MLEWLGTRQGGQLEESSVTQFAVRRSQSVWHELIGKLLPLSLDPGGLWAWLGGALLAKPTSLSALWELLPAGEHLVLVIGQAGSSLIHAKLYFFLSFFLFEREWGEREGDE